MTMEEKAPLGGMPIARAPEWTNPLVGMFALMAATYKAYGPESLPILSEGMKHLGRRTGEDMLAHELVPKDCTPTEWGRFTHQLMDLTGMYVYKEIIATDTVYEFTVPAEVWPYHRPVEYLGAPEQSCDISADWDRGCLETVSPRIVMTQPECAGRGDAVCRWRYELVPSND
ncbi:hypothetical protein AB0M46_24230 [Dactylosporangium sp. NPDC051485]|uniref:hypothetical protein n=1 Tax=Dactylosporangium sp. NPDC051485 TaxID=3154846 RepID=UPI003441D3DC